MTNLENEGEVKFGELLAQIEMCVKQNLYFPALISALVIPDIGGAIDSGSVEKPGERYQKWFDKYVKPRYAGRLKLTGKQCYFLRCSMLHEGKTEHKSTKTVFMTFPQSNAPVNPLYLKSGGLLIEPKTFCNNMIFAAYDWLDIVYNGDGFNENLKNFMTLYSCFFNLD